MRYEFRAAQLLFLLAVSAPDVGAATGQDYGPGDTIPSTAGKPHQCNNWWPIGPSSPSATGDTILSFRITKEGNVRDISVLHTSRDQFLDDAAKACVLTWQYKPATHKDGTPYEAPWIVRVAWRHSAQTPPVLETRSVTNSMGEMGMGMPRH